MNCPTIARHRRKALPRFRAARATRTALIRELHRREKEILRLREGNMRAAEAIMHLQIDLAGERARVAARESQLRRYENTPGGGVR